MNDIILKSNIATDSVNTGESEQAVPYLDVARWVSTGGASGVKTLADRSL